MCPEYSSKRKWECFANHCRNHKQGRRQKNPGMCHNTTVKWGQVEGWKELCLWQVQVYKPQFLQVVRGICIPMMASGHNTRLKPKVAIWFFVLLSFSYANCLFSLSPEWGLCWHPWLWCLLPSVIHLNPLNVGTDSINSQGSRLLNFLPKSSCCWQLTAYGSDSERNRSLTDPPTSPPWFEGRGTSHLKVDTAHPD